jgi:cytosine/adenosine deaminase-related metal-dependent hydrolase
MKTWIRGGDVVVWEDGAHVVLRGGDLVLEGDRVAFAGAGYAGPADVVVDAAGRLVSPGFVNLHCEVDLSHGPLWEDLARIDLYAIRPREWLWDPHEPPVFGPDEVRAGARLSMGTALRCGSTTVAGINTMVFKRWDDAPWEPDVFVEVADELGLRAYLSHHFRAGVVAGGPQGPEIAWNEAAGRRGLERGIAFVERLRRRPHDRVQGLLFPYTLDTMTPDLLRETAAAAARLQTRIRMHFAQSPAEVKRVLAEHGRDPVTFLEELGFLGPHVILTHALHIAADGDGDLERLTRHGVHVAHCPVVMRRSGRALRSFSRYRRVGLNVGLGTDTFPPDILEEMRWAALASKLADRHPTSGLVREVYEAATTGGADALGRPDLGRLAVGAKADVTIIDLSRVHVGPEDDPIKALVHYAVQEDVEHVYVDGRRVVEYGRVLGLDERETLRLTEGLIGKMAGQFAVWSGQPLDGLLPPSFRSA